MTHETHFLNVDLDLYSRSNLGPLVAGLGSRVIVLHMGRQGRIYDAHLEIAGSAKSADAVIKKFAALIRSLPMPARNLWNTATRREFSIGIQGGAKPSALDIVLEPNTIGAAAALKARIVITIYSAALKSA